MARCTLGQTTVWLCTDCSSRLQKNSRLGPMQDPQPTPPAVRQLTVIANDTEPTLFTVAVIVTGPAVVGAV